MTRCAATVRDPLNWREHSGSRLLTSDFGFAKTKVQPEMFLKTKDGGKQGTRRDVLGVPNGRVQRTTRNSYVPTRNIYENKRPVRSPESGVQTKHRARTWDAGCEIPTFQAGMFMKTKGRVSERLADESKPVVRGGHARAIKK